MARVREPINTDHRDVGPVVARGTGDNVLTRNGLMATECGEPFNVRQWMGVNPEMIRQLENDAHLHNTHRLQSNTCQRTLVSPKMPGTYHQAQQKLTADVLRPTQTPYHQENGEVLV